MKEVVILGGGVGGAFAAVELSRRLRDKAEITLVDREGKHYFPPSYPWLVMGWRRPDQVWRPLARLKAWNVKHRKGEVASIEPEERRVTVDGSELSYNYLLVSLGAQLEPSVIEGFAEGALHPYDLAGAVKLGDALKSFEGGTILVGVSRLPFKCPAAPYEMALLIDHHFRRRGMRDKVEIEFFTPEPFPLPAAGRAIGERAAAMMEGRDIPLHTKKEMDHIDSESKIVHFKGGAQMDYDFLVAVPPHTTCDAVRNSGLTKDGPWIPVDRYTMRSPYDDVYAVGDVTSIKTPSGNVPTLPKAGVFAEGQSKTACQNIVSEVLGGSGARWDGYGMCFLETGFGRAGMVRGNFYGEAAPAIAMRKPGRLWHWAKRLVEWRWLDRHFR